MLRVDPSPILFYLYLFIRSELVQVDPSWSDLDWRSKLIRSDLCTCLCTKALFFNVSCVFKVKCGYTVMCKYKKECLIKILKSAFCNFQELPFGYWKTFSHLWSCLKPAVFLLLFVCTKTFSLIFMFNFFVLKDGIWSPSEWVQKLIRGCEFLASDNNLLLYHTITSEQCFSCTLIG